VVGVLLALFTFGGREVVTGQRQAATSPDAISATESNIAQLGGELFTDWVFALEVTAGLLTIAVVGAVLLSRRPDRPQPIPEPESMADQGDEPLLRSGEGE